MSSSNDPEREKYEEIGWWSIFVNDRRSCGHSTTIENAGNLSGTVRLLRRGGELQRLASGRIRMISCINCMQHVACNLLLLFIRSYLYNGVELRKEGRKEGRLLRLLAIDFQEDLYYPWVVADTFLAEFDGNSRLMSQLLAIEVCKVLLSLSGLPVRCLHLDFHRLLAQQNQLYRFLTRKRWLVDNHAALPQPIKHNHQDT